MSNQGLTISEATALLSSALANHPKKRHYETYKFYDYPGTRTFFGMTKPDAGPDIAFTIRYDSVRNAQGSKLYDTDEVNVEQKTVQGTSRMVMGKTHWAIDIREKTFNKALLRKAIGLFDLVSSQRAAIEEDLANWFEPQFFYTPESATDIVNMAGLMTHLRPKSGEYTDGFQGDTVYYTGGTTGTIYQNVDLSNTDYTRLKNYCGTHQSKIDQKFLNRFRTAMMKTGFRPPITMKNTGIDPQGEGHKVFTSTDMVVKYQQFLDQVGSNYSKENGGASMFNMEWTPTPALDKTSDSDTHVVRAKEPIFAVRLPGFEFKVQEDLWMKEADPKVSAHNHNMLEMWTDWACQMVCPRPGRHLGFLFHKQFS